VLESRADFSEVAVLALFLYPNEAPSFDTFSARSTAQCSPECVRHRVDIAIRWVAVEML
jgi:hypothetical protein